MDDMTEAMRLIQADCVTDAAALDGTPFTAAGIGRVLGEMYAMIEACARGIERLAVNIEELRGER